MVCSWFSHIAWLSSTACIISFSVIPPLTIVPLSKTSGRSVEVPSSIPTKPKIALSSEKVPLSKCTYLFQVLIYPAHRFESISSICSCNTSCIGSPVTKIYSFLIPALNRYLLPCSV